MDQGWFGKGGTQVENIKVSSLSQLPGLGSGQPIVADLPLPAGVVSERDVLEDFDSPRTRARRFALASEARTSWRPLITVLPAAGGKIVAGFGASFLAKGLHDRVNRETGIGVGLVTGGYLLSSVGSYFLARDAYRVEPLRARLYAIASFMGVTLISGGIGMYQFGLLDNSTGVRLGSVAPLALGLTLLVGSVANGLAYSELVHGQVVVVHRQSLSQLLFTLGVGCTAAWGLTRPTHYQKNWYRLDAPLIGEILLTLSVFMSMFGYALTYASVLRGRALTSSGLPSLLPT